MLLGHSRKCSDYPYKILLSIGTRIINFFSSVLISSFSCGSNLFLVLHLVGVNYHRYYIYSCSVADIGAEGFTRV